MNNFEQDGTVALNGDWEFFWKQILTPEDIKPHKDLKPTAYYQFPGIWNTLKSSGKKYPAYGYATFVLTVHHQSPNTQLAIEIFDMATAYTLYVDGHMISSNGKVGRSHDTMLPEYRPRISHFLVPDKPIQIILQISNFNHRKGGPWSVIKLGLETQIRDNRIRKFFLNTFLIGSIFIMGLYHLALFILKRKFQAPLYFGLFCFMISLRSLTVNERYLHILLPGSSWDLLLKLEYASFYLSVFIIAMFIYSLFPKEFPKKILKIIATISLSFSAIVLIFPAHIFTHTLIFYQLFTVLSCLFIPYVLFKAFQKKREGVKTLSIGFVFLSVFVFHDILNANEVVETGYFLPIGMFIFIFSQAIVLAIRFSNALSRIESQKALLVSTNTTLIKEVHQRKKVENRLQQAQKMEAIGTLAGSVAHDLNNVLSAQVGYPDLLLMDLPKDSPLREPISIIKESGEKAAAIVQDLLTMARRGVIVKDVINLNDIVNNYLRSPEYGKLKRFHPRVTIEKHLDADLLNVLGSPVHLFKTIMNLLNNAAEAMPDGGKISITTQNKNGPELDASMNSIYSVLIISDTGTGIDQKDIKKIFEPFYTKKVMGKSGTTFTLTFPVTQEKIYDPGIDKTIRNYMGHGQSILVVDDMNDQRIIVSDMLKRLGYKVETCESGEKAVAYMKENTMDLLILDMIMDPGIDGCETYKQILEIRPGQKAIIASGYSETMNVKKTHILGAGEYLRKPYTIEKLGLAIKKELTKKS